MKRAPLSLGRLAFTAEGIPCKPDFDYVYPPAAGALARAEHVFLRGNGLPGRWAGRERFVVLETGFGLGNNFLATWAAWQADPERCERLVFVSIEKHPLSREDLARALAGSAVHELAQQLIDAWPPLTPNLHLLDFERGRVQLILALGDVAELLPELQLATDAIYLDGLAPAKNAAMWSDAVFKRIARLAAPGATAATWNDARALRDGLARHGFSVSAAPGFAGKGEMTAARYAPRFVPPPPAAFRTGHHPAKEALIIGGGLAGCAAAWALAQQGWHSTVLDTHAAPAMAASGNPAGLMHGIFNAPDGLHARWFRAAALHTARWAAPAVASGAVAGALDGLLRLDDSLRDEDAWARAHQRLAASALPPEVVSLLRTAAAQQASGVALPSPAWCHGPAGWLAPPQWCAHLLAQAGAAVRWQGGAAVATLRREQGCWQARDADDHLLAQAPVLVLAGGAQLPQCWPAGVPPLPTQAWVTTRGQTTRWPAEWAHHAPRLPLSGHGYALALPDQSLMLGATSTPDDADPALRAQDHRHNIERTIGLGVLPPHAAALDDATLAALPGRVGWRSATVDRLPLVGPPVAPLTAHTPARRDAPRHLARCHDAAGGVYLLGALGSRGLTSAALAGRLLAAWVSGAPFPVENSLRDALDPARLAH